MFAPPRRPKKGDTEEDLLREQREFERQKKGEKEATSTEREEEVQKEEDESMTKRVLAQGRLRERKPIVCIPPKPPGEGKGSAPFPEVLKATDDEIQRTSTAGKGKKRSVFAQMVAARKAAASSSASATTERRDPPSSSEVDFGRRSRILDGSGLPETPGESERIHLENVERLRAMSAEEIESSRAEVIRTLNPDILRFLMSRNAKSGGAMEMDAVPKGVSEALKSDSVKEKSTMKTKIPGEAAGGGSSKKQRLHQGLVHMGRPEPEKMEWTKDVEPPPQTEKGDPLRMSYSARFDFEGRLLPPSYDLGKEDPPASTSGLYHHGEEPGRPGYTVEELLTLVRSSNPQQRSLAFNTLANVLKTYKSGSLDGCLEQNLLVELLDNDLIILLRTSLDETIETVREAALLCLRQLIDDQFDEACLDVAYFSECGHLQPSLPTAVVLDPEKRAEFRKDEAGLKDVEVFKLDVVKGLLRTDLLQRWCYNQCPYMSSAQGQFSSF